jgi:hypothetical protein
MGLRGEKLSFVSDIWNSYMKPDKQHLATAIIQDLAGKREQSRRAQCGTTRILVHLTGVFTVAGLHPQHMAVQADSTHAIAYTNQNTIIQVCNTFSINGSNDCFFIRIAHA